MDWILIVIILLCLASLVLNIIQVSRNNSENFGDIPKSKSKKLSDSNEMEKDAEAAYEKAIKDAKEAYENAKLAAQAKLRDAEKMGSASSAAKEAYEKAIKDAKAAYQKAIQDAEKKAKEAEAKMGAAGQVENAKANVKDVNASVGKAVVKKKEPFADVKNGSYLNFFDSEVPFQPGQYWMNLQQCYLNY